MDNTRKKLVKCTESNYPGWTCHDCAVEAGGMFPPGHVATWHPDICPVCGDTRGVTEPRDYGYPKYKKVVKDWSDLYKKDSTI